MRWAALGRCAISLVYLHYGRFGDKSCRILIKMPFWTFLRSKKARFHEINRDSQSLRHLFQINLILIDVSCIAFAKTFQYLI